MAEAFVPVQAFPSLTPPNSANVDTFQMPSGFHRQVMVIGDPSTTNNIAPVDPVNGLAVNVPAGVIQAGTWNVNAVQSGVWTITSVPSGTQNVNVTASVPNLTLTSLPNVTVLQGTSPWITSGGGSSTGVTPVQAATTNGLTITGTVTSNQGTPLSPTVTNAWPVNVVSSVPNLTLTSLPTVTVTGTVTTTPSGTQNVNVVSSVPNLTLTSLPTVNVTQGTSPWVVSAGTAGNTPVFAATSNGLTVNGTLTVNQGTSPWVTSGGGASIPGNTVTALGSVADNAANPTNKIPVLPAVANASNPAWTEAHVVPLSVDLTGALRVSGAAGGGVAQLQARNSSNAWVDVGYFTGDIAAPVQVQNGLTITSMPTTTVNQGTSPWVTSVSSIGVTPVQAATSNGLTVTGTVASTQSGAWNVGVTNNPDVQISGGTLTGISNTVTVSGTVSATQGTSPWIVSSSNVGNTPVFAATANGLTITGTVTSNQGTPASATVANAWPVNVVSSVPNLTLTSLPTVTVTGTVTTTPSGTQNVNVISSVPNLTLTSLPTVTVNQGTSPWVVSSSAAGNTPVFASTSNGLTVNGTVTVNQGTPTSFANAWPVVNLNGNTISVLQSTPASNANAWPVVTVNGSTSTVVGNVSNNAAPPGSNNIGAMPAVATFAVPAYTEGNEVFLSVDRVGSLRTTVVGTLPNLTLTSLPTVLVAASALNGLTITGTVNQGTPASFANAWPVTNLNGNTISVLQSTPTSFANAWPVVNLNGNTISVLQSTPASNANAWPVVTVNGSTTTVTGSGIAGTPVSGVISVQGVTNGLPLNTAMTWIGLSNVVTGGIPGLLAVGGDAAQGQADGTNPVKIGGVAISSEISALGNLQRVGLVADLVGKQIVMPYANKENFVKGNASTTGTGDTSVVAAAGVGLKNYITNISIANTGATTAQITIKDGSGGSTIWQTIAPTAGGSNIHFPVPIAGSANTAVFFAAGSSSTTVYCSIAGYKGT